jgi:hypothetical protein
VFRRGLPRTRRAQTFQLGAAGGQLRAPTRDLNGNGIVGAAKCIAGGGVDGVDCDLREPYTRVSIDRMRGTSP